MLDKKQRKENLKQVVQLIAKQFRYLEDENISKNLNLEKSLIKMQLQSIIHLAANYDKKIEIKLVDCDE